MACDVGNTTLQEPGESNIVTREWTSGNRDIDDCIKEYQIKWIPFDTLVDVEVFKEGDAGSIFSATWCEDDKLPTSRMVEFKALPGSQTEDPIEFIREFKSYIMLDSSHYKGHVYGITQYTKTNQYMIVKIYSGSGRCPQCKQTNTCTDWCQPCDPYSVTQGWKSGIDYIDGYLNSVQLSNEGYSYMIEWIPFDRLNNIRIKKRLKSDPLCSAIWLDGLRQTKESRTSPYTVELMVLHNIHAGALEPKKELKNVLGHNDFRIYGITQNTEANQCMAIFDEHYNLRNKFHGECAHCKRDNTFLSWCKSCDPFIEIQGWTSGNKDIDDCVKEYQLNSNNYEKGIEWIPSDRLNNVQMIRKDEFETIFSATWLDGVRTLKSLKRDEDSYSRSRLLSCKVELKAFNGSPKSILEFIKEFKSHLENNDNDSIIHGITQNMETNQYMIVLDEFGSMRNTYHRMCAQCLRNNTHYNWCISCDPLIETRGWTSGNKEIDAFIKELQLKCTGYCDIIEWIPFDRLDNLRVIRKNGANSIFLATWLDGKRSYPEVFGSDYPRTRSPPCSVDLKALGGSQTSTSEFIKELKNLLELVNDKPHIYGVTQNKETNQYMIVFDEFGYFRSSLFGECAQCGRSNSSEAWCQSCDPSIVVQRWKSGNADIDDFIRELQLKSTSNYGVVEWIPFNRLNNIQRIEGVGPEVIFSATWLDGIRTYEETPPSTFIKSRMPCTVELKALHSSQPNSREFTEEINNYAKSKIVKLYGITQDTETNQFMVIYDAIDFMRNREFGRCARCRRYNTSQTWCQSCDPKIMVAQKDWTSGNKDIDSCIREFQFESTEYEKVIEWIPFDRLKSVAIIGKGGFSAVYSAIWMDGARKSKFGSQSRSDSCVVALKTLPGSQTNSSDFLREFRNQMECRFEGSSLEVYGLTQNPTTGEYLMVYQYANRGSLHGFITSNFKGLTWNSKLCQLCDITKDLTQIHKAGYIHNDFHSGNVLLNQYVGGTTKCYIADLGLSRKESESDSEDHIYGVMPYVAPEILSGQQYAKSADIYSLGVMMAEISTGNRPFDGLQFDTSLALDIIKGLRPEFAPGTPDCYVELAKKCMDSNPEKRPTADVVHSTIYRWWHDMDQEKCETTQKFKAADQMIQKLPIISQKHESFMYTSKAINTREIKKAYYSTTTDSAQINLCISEESMFGTYY
ncbi:1044_t:CDS:2 [Acaulospora morrowiae]|uniref:1044_t:CDS:1 n=1 Tax=Acaulospora morrowiae TaxID=94023 RepID=A0A9N9AGA7_9GLOM|nr:1044_t:CDS:2 [Acaulospora morrowiae]